MTTLVKTRTKTLGIEGIGISSTEAWTPKEHKQSLRSLVGLRQQVTVKREPALDIGPIQNMQSNASSLPVDVAMNRHGLRVIREESHVYQDVGETHLLVYGGSPEQKAELIASYLKRHHNVVLFSADETGYHRIPWYLSGGTPVSGAPIRTGGFFGLFARFARAPDPQEFYRVIA